MVSLKQKGQSGFTIVELLIVIVIIGILAGLVITQFLNANQSARDSERKTDINSLASQLDVYFNRTGGYPTLDDFNSPDWRKSNQISSGDSNKALADPQNATVTTLVAAPVAGSYSYQPSSSKGGTCVSPTDKNGENITTGTLCDQYTLSAALENKNDKSGKDVGGLWLYQRNQAQ